MKDKNLNRSRQYNTFNDEITFKKQDNNIKANKHAKNERETVLLEPDYPRINTDNL